MENELKTAVLSCGRELEYRHVVKKGLKNIYIGLDAQGIVTVRSPAVPDSVLKSVLEKKAEWIFRRRKTVRESLSSVEFAEGAEIPFFGERLPLRIVRNTLAGLGRAEVYTASGCVAAEINPYLFKEEYFFKALDSFYKTRAEMRITPMLEARAAEMGLKFSKVTFRRTKGRWGSCSSSGNISINYELAKLPLRCADYVCVHELAHLAHPNHGAGFWALVEKYVPDWAEIRKYMKGFSLR